MHLTKEKRTDIALALDAQAKMFSDSAKEAEDFLSRWRRARRVLYREGLIDPSTQEIVQMFAAQNCTGESLQFLTNMMENKRGVLMNHMFDRLSNSVREYLYSRQPRPRTSHDSLHLGPSLTIETILYTFMSR